MSLPLKIDLSQDYTIEYDLIEKLLEGTEDGQLSLEKETSPESSRYCYLPLFRNDDWDQWHLGAYFYDKYAIAFDSNEQKASSIIIGLKDKSKLADIVTPKEPEVTPEIMVPDEETLKLLATLRDLEVQYSVYEQRLRSNTDALNEVQQ